MNEKSHRVCTATRVLKTLKKSHSYRISKYKQVYISFLENFCMHTCYVLLVLKEDARFYSIMG